MYEILFNPQMHRWEVYGENCVMRNFEIQPVFVSADYAKCIAYKEAVEK